MQNLKLKKVNLVPILLKSVILLPFWDLSYQTNNPPPEKRKEEKKKASQKKGEEAFFLPILRL